MIKAKKGIVDLEGGGGGGGEGLQEVSHDETLAGKGTAPNPLSAHRVLSSAMDRQFLDVQISQKIRQSSAL